MQSLLFSFNGRINRAKFWLASIAVDIVGTVLFWILAAVTGGSLVPDADGMPSFGGGIGGEVAAFVIFAVMVWIGLAISVKRWHDRDKTGWWVLISLVPVIGGLWFLIECGFLKGTTGANKYGADPLATI